MFDEILFVHSLKKILEKFFERKLFEGVVKKFMEIKLMIFTDKYDYTKLVNGDHIITCCNVNDN